MADLYSVLGCDQQDTLKSLRAAYQALLLLHHPDKTGGESAAFLEVREAWRVLGEEESRRRYDAELANMRLAGAQGAAVALTLALGELGAVGECEVGAGCRCGGSYAADRTELEEELEGEVEVLLDCDTCSLQILVTVS